MSPAPSRSFCLVLHLHMPFVVNHGMWPHGSRWLCEAIVDAYLPLVDLLDRMRGRGVRPSWNLSVSPVLAEQLASPKVRTATREFLTHRLAACADDRYYFERRQHEPLVGLTHHWETHLRTLQAVWDRIDGNLLRSLREFQAQGLIELITSAASHAYLPLLGQDESIHLQIRQGVECHRRHFGVHPRGLWLPECGYRPRYEWRAPAGIGETGDRRLRPGIEEFLPSHGLGFFVLDHSLIADVPPSSWYREVFGGIRRLPRARVGRSGERRFRSAHTPYRVASRTGTGEATAFIRDAGISAMVWSRDTGYPGTTRTSSTTSSISPGGSDTGGSRSADRTWNPRRSTIPPRRRSASGATRCSSWTGWKRAWRLALRPKAAEWPAPPPTRNCSATGGTKARHGWRPRPIASPSDGSGPRPSPRGWRIGSRRRPSRRAKDLGGKAAIIASG